MGAGCPGPGEPFHSRSRRQIRGPPTLLGNRRQARGWRDHVQAKTPAQLPSSDAAPVGERCSRQPFWLPPSLCLFPSRTLRAPAAPGPVPGDAHRAGTLATSWAAHVPSAWHSGGGRGCDCHVSGRRSEAEPRTGGQAMEGGVHEGFWLGAPISRARCLQSVHTRRHLWVTGPRPQASVLSGSQDSLMGLEKGARRGECGLVLPQDRASNEHYVCVNINTKVYILLSAGAE